MSSRSSFSLGRALSSAFTSLPAAWGGAWLALVLLWAVGSFGQFLPFGFAVNTLVAALVLLVAKIMTVGALYRTALFGRTAKTEGLGFGGLQFAAPELRLLAAGLIVGVFYLLIVAAIFIVFAVAFNASGMAGDYGNTLAAVRAMILRHEGADWVFIGYILAAYIFLIFLGIKFSLVHAATIAERRIVTLNALGLSSGNVGKLFLGLVALVVPFTVVVALAVHHFHSHLMLAVAGDFEMLTPRFVAHAALHAAAVFLILPLAAGFLSSAYRQIVDLRAK